MMTRTTRTLSLATACILVIVASAGSASALQQHLVAFTEQNIADGCTVDTETPTCEYDCNPGQKLRVSATPGSGDRAHISTSCGGTSAECDRSHNSCSDTSETVQAPDIGTCELHHGSSGSCAASYTGHVNANL